MFRVFLNIIYLFVNSADTFEIVLLQVRVDLHVHGLRMSFQKHGRPEMSRQLEAPPAEGLFLSVLLANIPHEASFVLAQNQVPQLQSTEAGTFARRIGLQLTERRSRDCCFGREIPRTVRVRRT